MVARTRWVLPLLLAVLGGCEHQGGVVQASVAVTVPPRGDDEEITAAERAAVPGDLAGNPVRLNGLSNRVVRAALGPPNFRRRDKGVEIWQYYGEGCVLDLFIYDENGQRRVTHHVVRSTNGEPASTCFRGIVESRRAAQPS